MIAGSAARPARSTPAPGRPGPQARWSQQASAAEGIWYVPAVRTRIPRRPPALAARRRPICLVRLGRLWDRFADDRDLVRAKLMLLAGLIILTAAAERWSR